ncbi:MAG: cysteine peptidase family C39 domain-containing protein, partial [Agathobacter rectalis]
MKRVVVSNRNKQIQRGLDIPTLSVFRKKESNMRGCLQHDENDCGLACILTICKFLKICVDETALRKNIFLGNDGLSLYGITEVFRTIGMKSLAVEGTNIE